MTELNQKTVDEFKALIKKEYGVEYSDEEARVGAENLVGLFLALAKLDSKQNLEIKENEN